MGSICGSKNNTNNIFRKIILDENKENIKGDYMFPGIGIHIPDNKSNIISNQKEKSICKIPINKGPKGTGFGTGFLCIIGV